MRRNCRKMRIRTKFLLYIVLPLLVVASASAFYMSSKNFSQLGVAAKKGFVLDTDLVASKISAENIRGISLAKSAAVSAEILFGNRASSIKMIRRMLEAFPFYTGATIAYSINADFNDFRADLGLKNIRDGKDVYADGAIDSYDFASNKTAATIDDWIAASGGGRFGAYLGRVDGDLVLSPLSESDISANFASLRKRMESGEKDLFLISEPGLNQAKVMSVEYCSAVISDMRLAGEVSFMSDFSRIQTIISSVRTVKGEEYFLISTQNRIIASSRFENIKTVSISDYYLDSAGNFVQNFLKEENGMLVRDESSKIDLAKYNGFYSSILQFAVDAAKNSASVSGEYSERKVSIFKDAKSSTSFYVDVSAVKGAKWLVVHIRPEVDFLSTAASSLAGNISMIVAVIAVGLIGLIAASGMSNRIDACRSAADNMAQGVFVDLNSTRSSSDETGRLLRSMSRAVKSVADSTERSIRSKETLRKTSKAISEILGNYTFESNSIDALIQKMSAMVGSIEKSRAEAAAELEKIDSAVNSTLSSGQSSRKEIVFIDDLTGVFSRNATSSMRRNASMSDKMRLINGVSADIEKVADESNLLSLNASIEAAKSGRSGGAFSVVAREINRISESISNSSSAMKTIVGDIESAIGYDSSESARLMETLGDFSQKYAKILSGMDVVVDRMKNAIPVVSQAMERVRKGGGDIDKANDMLSEISQSLKQLASLRAQLMASSEALSDEVRKMNNIPGNTNE